MRFAQPAWLLLAIPLLVGLALSFRHVHGMARARKKLAFGVRGVLILLIVAALAGLESRRTNEGIATQFVLDRSDSISEEQRSAQLEFVSKAISEMSERDAAGVVVFGRSPLLESVAGGRRTLPAIQSRVNGSATDLSAAIRLASAAFPEGKARRIVVLSDGNQTLGDAEAAAEVAGVDGVQIDVVHPAERAAGGEALVASMDTPDIARADQPIPLRVTMESTVSQQAILVLDRDGKQVSRTTVKLQPGRNSVVLSDRLTAPGFYRYRATLVVNDDRDSRNNVGASFVRVRGRPQVLVASGRKNSELAAALRKNGIQVVEGGAEVLPLQLEEAQNYEAILLNDLNASELTASQMALLQRGLRDAGIGFAMIGGENSFLPGGYYGTTVADMLPVDLNIRQRKSFASVSVLIIIDCSGSMSMEEDGVMKLRLAAKAAEQTVSMLAPTDRVGVAGSTSGIEFVAPMQPLTNKAEVIKQIRRINITGGGIFIGPSIEAAEKVIRKEPSKVRHLIVMADGADSTDFRDAVSRVAKMRGDRITTSVIAVGQGKDVNDLRLLARAGGGRFFVAEKASKLPALVTQDVSVISRAAIEEGAFIPKLTGWDEMLRGVDAMPPLLAYCLSEPRPLARVLLRTHKDDPLLAIWQVGLGTSMAFTSDAQSRWARQWMGWPDFGTFWSQSVRSISRRASEHRVEVTATDEGGLGRLMVRAFDSEGSPVNLRDNTIRVGTPSGKTIETTVSQEAPGLFTGTFPASEIGSYVVTVGAGRGRGVHSTGFTIAYPVEYRTYRPNLPLLDRLAELTGGKALESPGQVWRAVTDPGVSIYELWPALVLAAALLLPLDIGIRRIALPVAEIWQKGVGRFRRRSAKAPASEAMEQLRRARDRASTGPRTPGAVTPAVMTSDRVRPEPNAPSPASGPPSKPSTSPVGSTAGSLLESKRKRSGQ